MRVLIHLLVKCFFIFFYLPPGKFMELRIYIAVCLLKLRSDRFTFIESIIDSLPPVKDRAEFFICGHFLQSTTETGTRPSRDSNEGTLKFLMRTTTKSTMWAYDQRRTFRIVQLEFDGGRKVSAGRTHAFGWWGTCTVQTRPR